MSAQVVATLGRRELNKLDKVARIRDAARRLFAEDGYEEATTRRIAKLANVALGTLFLYADDKRDILFLVVNDDLARAVDEGERALDPDKPLSLNLIAFFRPTYELCAANPALMRLVLREVTFYEKGKQAQRYLRSRERLISLVGRAVRYAIDAGEAATPEDPDYVGAVLFSVLQAELRRWLSGPSHDVEAGLEDARRAFNLILPALTASGIPAPHPSSRAAKSGPTPERPAETRNRRRRSVDDK